VADAARMRPHLRATALMQVRAVRGEPPSVSVGAPALGGGIGARAGQEKDGGQAAIF
jgi:hypothetical protein